MKINNSTSAFGSKKDGTATVWMPYAAADKRLISTLWNLESNLALPFYITEECNQRFNPKKVQQQLVYRKSS